MKQYADLGGQAVEALASFVDEVRTGAFPTPEHGFEMATGEGEKLSGALSLPSRGAVADGLVAPTGDLD